MRRRIVKGNLKWCFKSAYRFGLSANLSGPVKLITGPPRLCEQ